MPKLSVIIPVFNTEKYIKKCADSLFEQKMTDVEYIFVDDCSSDRSIEVVKESTKSHPSIKGQVKFLKMDHNSGSVSTRIEGLKQATGDYVIFCDSDDWIEPDMYSLLYNKAVTDDLDIVIGSYRECKGKSHTFRRQLVSDKSDLISSLLSYRLSPSMCIKMIKRDLWNQNITAPSACMGEDSVFSLQILMASQNTGFEPDAIYNYHINPSGMCQSLAKEKILRRYNGAVSNTEQILEILISNNLLNRYKKEVDVLKARHRDYLLPLIGDSHYFKMWHNTFPEINFRLLFNKYMPLKLKIRYLLAILRIYPLIKKIRIKFDVI